MLEVDPKQCGCGTIGEIRGKRTLAEPFHRPIGGQPEEVGGRLFVTSGKTLMARSYIGVASACGMFALDQGALFQILVIILHHDGSSP